MRETDNRPRHGSCVNGSFVQRIFCATDLSQRIYSCSVVSSAPPPSERIVWHRCHDMAPVSLYGTGYHYDTGSVREERAGRFSTWHTLHVLCSRYIRGERGEVVGTTHGPILLFFSICRYMARGSHRPMFFFVYAICEGTGLGYKRWGDFYHFRGWLRSPPSCCTGRLYTASHPLRVRCSGTYLVPPLIAVLAFPVELYQVHTCRCRFFGMLAFFFRF